MKQRLVIRLVCSIALAVAAAAAQTGPALRAQAPSNSGPANANQGKQPAAEPPPQTKQQQNQNPFPEDTSSVPLMPSRDNPNLPISGDEATRKVDLPSVDADPVRSPEEEGVAAGESSSSSSLAGVGDLTGPDDATQTPQRGKRNKNGAEIVPEHHETAAEDEDVGKYYLDSKNWSAARSRFQSALVLDPDNPDVYWGLAESERHLGNFAEARANYQKVVDYDPGSRHGKDARKALRDPEIANAKAAQQTNASANPSVPAPQ